METALSAFSAGQVIQPVRNMLTIEEAKRFLGIMPAVTEEGMGAKLVCFFPKNAGSNLPTHLAMIMLFRPDTGQPLAFMDGRLITEMRTAAVSAAVTKYLASPESRILALLASGVQARAHLQALRHVCRFAEIRVWSRTPDHAKRSAELHGVRSPHGRFEVHRYCSVQLGETLGMIWRPAPYANLVELTHIAKSLQMCARLNSACE